MATRLTHFVQTKAWAAVRAAQGQRVEWVGEQLLLVKGAPAPFKPVGIMSQIYTEGLDWEALKTTGKRLGLSHIQIDPNDERSNFEIPEQTKRTYNLVPTESLLLRHSVLIDLNQSEEELLAQMKKNWRYNALLARKKGVQIALRDDPESLEIFIDLFFQTVEAKSFLGRTPDYYRQVWNILREQGAVQILIASFEGKPAVARMLGLTPDTVYTLYTGTARDLGHTKAAYLALWETIVWAKNTGHQFVNLWGVDLAAAEGDPMHGFTQFKLGFGGRVVEYAPAYNMVIDPLRYRAFKLANKTRLRAVKLKRKLLG